MSIVLLPPSLDVTVEMHMTERITGLVGVEAAKSNAFYPNMPRALLLACAMPYIPNRWVCVWLHHTT